MAKRIAVFTADRNLFKKIQLDAPVGVEVINGDCDSPLLRLVDIDTASVEYSDAVTMSYTRRADLSLPFRLGTISEMVNEKIGISAALRILPDEKRCVSLKGEKIKLTKTEFSLLLALIKRDGGYVTREELLREVWADNADSGIINVYIHYLRTKLEKHGEKIILSSREGGYKIDKKHLGGEE